MVEKVMVGKMFVPKTVGEPGEMRDKPLGECDSGELDLIIPVKSGNGRSGKLNLIKKHEGGNENQRGGQCIHQIWLPEKKSKRKPFDRIYRMNRIKKKDYIWILVLIL